MVLTCVVGDRRCCVHVEGLDYVAEAAPERLDVVLFLLSPLRPSILEPYLKAIEKKINK